MRRQALAVTLLFALAASGCSETASEVCREVCQREHACVEDLEDEDDRLRFDRGECVTTCSALERDPVGAELVRRHAECVERAATCAEVLACP